jgi:Transcriptional regulatory protein, C terminal
MRRSGRVVPRDAIVDAVWDFDHEVEENTLDTFIRFADGCGGSGRLVGNPSLTRDYGSVALMPMGVSNLFAAYVVRTRRLSARDPGEVRSRRLHRTCTAYFTLARRVGRS